MFISYRRERRAASRSRLYDVLSRGFSAHQSGSSGLPQREGADWRASHSRTTVSSPGRATHLPLGLPTPLFGVPSIAALMLN